MRVHILLFVLAVILCSPVHGLNLTGFLPAAGEGLAAFGYTDESYDEFWRGQTRVPTPPALGEITTRSASLWLSYGLSDRWALIADVAHVSAEGSGTGNLEDSGAQDANVLIATRLFSHTDGRVEQSLVGAAGVRTALASYEENAPVARGDRTTDALFRIVYLVRAGSFYWSQQVGFDLRGGDAPNGIPIYTELGWSTGRLTWIGFYSRLIADGGTDIGDPGFTFPSNREEFERVGAKVVAGITADWKLFAGGFTTLDGRNAGDADGLFLGLIRHF